MNCRKLYPGVIRFLFLTCLLASHPAYSVTIGQDDAVEAPQGFVSLSGWSNRIAAYAFLSSGFMLKGNQTRLEYSSVFPVCGPISLFGGFLKATGYRSLVRLEEHTGYSPRIAGGIVEGSLELVGNIRLSNESTPSVNGYSQASDAGKNLTVIQWQYDTPRYVTVTEGGINDIRLVDSYSGSVVAQGTTGLYTVDGTIARNNEWQDIIALVERSNSSNNFAVADLSSNPISVVKHATLNGTPMAIGTDGRVIIVAQDGYGVTLYKFDPNSYDLVEESHWWDNSTHFAERALEVHTRNRLVAVGTNDGILVFSYSATINLEASISLGVGIKSLSWAGDHHIVAIDSNEQRLLIFYYDHTQKVISLRKATTRSGYRMSYVFWDESSDYIYVSSRSVPSAGMAYLETFYYNRGTNTLSLHLQINSANPHGILATSPLYGMLAALAVASGSYRSRSYDLKLGKCMTLRQGSVVVNGGVTQVGPLILEDSATIMLNGNVWDISSDSGIDCFPVTKTMITSGTISSTSSRSPIGIWGYEAFLLLDDVTIISSAAPVFLREGKLIVTNHLSLLEGTSMYLESVVFSLDNNSYVLVDGGTLSLATVSEISLSGTTVPIVHLKNATFSYPKSVALPTVRFIVEGQCTIIGPAVGSGALDLSACQIDIMPGSELNIAAGTSVKL